MKCLIYILVFTLCSCSLMKQTTKSKKETKKDVSIDRIIKETSTKTIYRPKDSVVYVPNFHFKDTTIYKRGTTNTIRTVYNSQGQVSQIDCISDEIKEMFQSYKETIEKEQDNSKITEKDKTSDTQFKLSPLNILYIFIGLSILLIIYKKV